MTVRIGLVGYGLAGRVFHAPLFARAGLDFAAVASRRPEAVHADWPGIGVVPTPAALFAREDIDLVVIVTPNSTHASLGIEALDSGKHVVIDKPFSNTVAEAEAVFAAADRANRLAVPFQNRRFDSDFLTLRKLIEEGALGEVLSLRSHFDRYAPEGSGRWRERPGPGAGMVYDLGVHLVDQAVCLFGRPDWVEADIRSVREGMAVDDAFTLRLAFGRTRVTLESSMLVPHPRERFAVHGTRGSYFKNHLDHQEEQLFAGMQATDGAFGMEPPDRWADVTRTDTGAPVTRREPSVPGRHFALYEGVRAAIEGGASAPVARSEVIDVLRIVELAFEASESGRRQAF